MTTEGDSEMASKMGILAINQLSYKLRPDLSVSVSKCMQKQFPQTSSSAPRETITFILNSGASYLDLRDSYLALDVKNTSVVPGTQTAYFGKYGGSACNLIERLTITSRSGAVIERVDKANLLAAIRVEYMHDNAYRETGPGSSAGMELDPARYDWPVGSTVRVCIPLSMISPFVDNTESLLPAQLCSGMRFEFLLSEASDAMASSSDDFGQTMNYAISNASLNLQSYLLSDVVLRTLNQMAASSGLEVVSSTVYAAVGERSTNTINLELGKSASRALSCIYAERPKVVAIDSTCVVREKSSPTDYVTEAQFRCGSLYFPQTSIRATSQRTSSPELYVQALQAFNRFRVVNTISSSASEIDYRNGSGCIAQTLERSDILRLSGIPLSNSRVLALSASWSISPPSPVSSVFWLNFVILVRVFSSNVVLEV
jgi:hypothetical protein